MTPCELVHQLNNDLCIVRGRLALLVEAPDLPPAVQTDATRALQAAERAVALLQQYQQEAGPPGAGE